MQGDFWTLFRQKAVLCDRKFGIYSKFSDNLPFTGAAVATTTITTTATTTLCNVLHKAASKHTAFCSGNAGDRLACYLRAECV